jgi:ribosome maturation factor RimP
MERSSDNLSGHASTGVTADDCITVCRRLMDAFAVEGEMLGSGREPELEVSSPGLDRVMRLPWHFVNGIGSSVKLWLADRAVSGVIEDCSKDEVLAFRESENPEVQHIPLSEVRKAQIIF